MSKKATFFNMIAVSPAWLHGGLQNVFMQRFNYSDRLYLLLLKYYLHWILFRGAGQVHALFSYFIFNSLFYNNFCIYTQKYKTDTGSEWKRKTEQQTFACAFCCTLTYQDPVSNKTNGSFLIFIPFYHIVFGLFYHVSKKQINVFSCNTWKCEKLHELMSCCIPELNDTWKESIH